MTAPTGLAELLALSAIMGLSIFLSLPIVLRRSRTTRLVSVLTAAAIGILVFVLADVWGDVSSIIYPSGSFVADPKLTVIFAAGVLGAFFVLYFLENSTRRPGATREVPATTTALIVALAIGFQNLTEGMVLGTSWAAGLSGLLAVIFAGFFLQNVTEGFPIAGPLLSTEERRVGLFSAYFLLGGVPTIVGAGVGYFWSSPYLTVAFDAMAIGTCLYAIIPMFKVAFRPSADPAENALKTRLTYIGIGLGFAVGFLVNAI
jgi:zinc transporter, ZIP family